MQFVDYGVLLVYLAGVLLVSLLVASRNRTTSQMFAAGEQCPWWVSGLSSFMTMFSAGTFVVWGSIAYKHGLVAVSINLCYGVAALLVGWTVAGRWKRLGIQSAAEFVKLRFGEGALQLYTWSMMIFRMIGSGVGLYSLCILLLAAISAKDPSLAASHTPQGEWLAWSILGLGSVIVFYTIIGGLWGVLMTDLLQFIVLNIAVLFVVPLVLADVGGVQGIIEKAPAGFFSLTTSEYSWAFMVGWIVIHYFVVGAEWAYVQRYLCVPTEVDARKSAYLFGILYLVSPLFWMLPPLVQRIRAPFPGDADVQTIQALAENAYINVCSDLLPTGMLGLLLAAMISATADTVSGQLNVFAGAITNDIIKPRLRKPDDERRLVWIGRCTTLLLGIVIIGIALAIPYLGGAERVIVPVTSLVVVPLIAPLLIGLVSTKLPQFTVWVTAGVCTMAIVAVKVILPTLEWETPSLQMLASWTASQTQSTDLLLGAALPAILVVACYLGSRGISPGWLRLTAIPKAASPTMDATLYRQIVLIVAWSLAACGLLMGGLAFANRDHQGLLTTFAVALVGLAAWLFRASPSPDNADNHSAH